MSNEFEYVTYTDDEWPAAPENEDVEADYDYDDWVAGSGWTQSSDRTEVLISQGRTSAAKGKFKGARQALAAGLALAVGLARGARPAC